MGDKGLQGTSGVCVCKALTLDKFGKGKHTILLQEKQKEATKYQINFSMLYVGTNIVRIERS